jgi:hypothetical protein
MNDPRDAWLAELGRCLHLPPAHHRRILAELTDHLQGAVEAELSGGATPEEAQRRAVARMGRPAEVAAQFEAQVGVAPAWVRVGLQVARLGALGLLVAGLSGFLAEPVGRLTGMDFFFGDERPMAATLGEARCARLLELQRGQHTCADALVEHHYGELVEYGLVATLLGALGLAVVSWMRRSVEPTGLPAARLELLASVAGALAFLALALSELQPALGARGLAPGSGRPLLQVLVFGAAGILLVVQASRRFRRTPT